MSARQTVLVVAIVAVTVLSLGLGLLGARPASAGATASPAPAVTSSVPRATPSPAEASRMAFEQQVLSSAKDRHIPLSAVSLPNLLGQATVQNGVVSPISTQAPAPMGIGDIGVTNTTGTAVPYTLRSTSWEGSITVNNVNTFLLTNDGALNASGTNNTFGVQLNTVTNNTTVGSKSTYAFWTQNVVYYNLYPGYITFLDNVWNFSSPATELTSGTIYSGNGTPVYPEFYYDFGPSVPVSFPFTVHLFINSSTTDIAGIGYTTIRFGYDVSSPSTPAAEASGVYDTVLFNSTVPFASVPTSPFLVDGSQLTPTNFLLYDAEIMIGGPGGGTTTSVYGINATEQLQYLTATNKYANAPSAWDAGTDTGETSEGVAETYTTPGIVSVGAGPSFVMPFWNATPGGNAGRATFSGAISPTNAFVFFSPGHSFNTSDAAWAPTQTASHVAYALPPGTYTVEGMLSDYTPTTTVGTGTRGGTVALHLSLTKNTHEGVYTPLYAWNNGQLAAIASSGRGTPGSPYVLFNNGAAGGLSPVFGEYNDYLYPVFPGVLLATTTAYTELNSPFLLNLTYSPVDDAVLERLGLPLSNNLMFEIFDASNVSIWDARGISGWFFYEDYGPTGLLPLANVVIWGGSHDLVGDSTFVSQGSSLLLAGSNPAAPTGNVVWGNTFVNSTVLSPTMYPGNGAVIGPPIGIFAFEAGDLIYNNYVATSIPVYAPDQNMFSGAPQLNLESWNLPMVLPVLIPLSFNGYTLGGTVVPSLWQGGNYWANYVPGSGLPYTDYGYIASGGDYFPYPITAYGVVFTLNEGRSTVIWSVTLNGVTQTTALPILVFYETPGSYTYTDAVVAGHGVISPASGTISVVSSSLLVPLTLKA